MDGNDIGLVWLAQLVNEGEGMTCTIITEMLVFVIIYMLLPGPTPSGGK